MKDLGLSVQDREQKAADAAKQKAMAEYEVGMKRRLAPHIAGQQKNHAAALAEIQRAFNEDPAFEDGMLINFETDEAGAPVVGADGTVGLIVKDKNTGQEIGRNRVPVEGDDGVYLSFFGRMRDPIGHQKKAEELAEKDRERKLKIEDEKRQHEQKKELYGIKSAQQAARGGSRPATLQIAEAYAEANDVPLAVGLNWVKEGKSLSESELTARILPNLLKSRAYAGDVDGAMLAAKEMAKQIRSEPATEKPAAAPAKKEPAPKPAAAPKYDKSVQSFTF
jgi:hypothetical protein